MKKYFPFLFTILLSGISYAQVGVNATTIDPSAALDIQYGSSPKGLLTPRMTTLQRTGIATPADGLIVYDTDLKSFFHYKTNPTSWIRMSSDVSGRLNFKRIKSLSDLTTEKKTDRYLLSSNTYYEINGAIILDLPLELNNAYLVGLDAYEDRLIRTTGDLFVGSTGGTVKNLTISVTGGGAVFALSGANTESLIFRDSIVKGCSNVGSIAGFGLVFSSVIQYGGNSNGITYTNIGRLLLNNIAWIGLDNKGTYEKYEGTFNLIQKLGGSMEVSTGAIGVDVSANPTITGDAVMESVVFTGTPTATGAYIKRYTTGSYIGYNFNEKWTVRCAGIPVETDAVAVGDVNLDLVYGTGKTIVLTTNTAIKIGGETISNNFFRTSNVGTDTTLKYLGHKKRFFTVNAVASFRGTDAVNTIYVFYIALNGTVIPRSKTYIFTANASDVIAVPVQTIVEMAPNDTVDVRVTRYSGSSDMLLVSLSLFMR